MNKEELLEILANNISCFENVTLDDFRLLSSLETFELASVNDNVSRVTPLLKQIANYALIEDVIDDIDIVSLRDSFTSDDDKPIYDAI